MAQKYFKFIKKLGKDKVKQNELLAKHTTFKIGGAADLFYEAKTEKEILKAVNLAKKLKIPYFILGRGSNLLVNDKGFRGLVIKIKNSQVKVKKINSQFKIIGGAGAPLRKILEKAIKIGGEGLEFLAGIPGTLGGAIRGNAGAWGKNIGDNVSRVKILTCQGKIKWISQKDCNFAYRDSRFKKTKEVILAGELALKKGKPTEIKKKVLENLEKRKGQPTEPSAGCIFINPKPLSAGYLIEQCGLKGKKIGKIQISLKHGNFFINLGGGKASDVIKLIKLAKNEVKRRFRIKLKEEISLLGFAKI